MINKNGLDILKSLEESETYLDLKSKINLTEEERTMLNWYESNIIFYKMIERGER